MRTLFLLGIVPLLGLSVMAQRAPGGARQVQSPPSGITLPPGYMHEGTGTADSREGRIWKDQGLEIHYSTGTGSGHRVDREVLNEVWSKHNTVGPNIVQIAMTKDRVLLATITPVDESRRFSRINFWSSVHSDEDIAEMLLMVMAYKP